MHFSENIQDNNFRALRSPTKLSLLSALALQLALTVLSLISLMRLWDTSLLVPFNYFGDTVYYLVLVKSIASGGWIWFNENLSAPFGLDLAAFPQNLTFSSFVVKLISLFTSEPGLIINLFWIIMTVMTSAVCHVSLRLLRTSLPVAVLASTLYALLPYAFFRNTSHMSLTYTFVPIVMAYSICVLAQRSFVYQNFISPFAIRCILIVSCIAIGFDYIYNAFFSCFFLAFTGAFGAAFAKTWQPVRSIALLILGIGICAFINVCPTLVTWYYNGVPLNANYKTAAEAEIYGLKIRHILSSAFTDTFSRNLVFPVENENASARFGAVLGIGYVIALVGALFGSRAPGRNLVWAAGVLTVVGTLFATIGGFGVIFNILVVPDIRAYNRISVFLAFASIFVGCYYLDLLYAKVSDDRRLHTWRYYGFFTLLGVLFLIALYDQGQAARPLRAQYAPNKAQFDEERNFVKLIEIQVPKPSKIFQLPYTAFPSDPGRERMVAYDHARPYVWSSDTSWSWPNFSERYEAWITAVGRPGDDTFIQKLVASGFDAIWVDRFGYKDDEFSSVERILVDRLGQPTLVSGSGRYLYFSLVSAREGWMSSTPSQVQQDQRVELLEAIGLSFAKGFYQQENVDGSKEYFRWSGNSSSIFLTNPSDRMRRVRLVSQVRSNPGSKLRILAVNASSEINLSRGSENLDVSVEISPKSKTEVSFLFDGSRITAPGDIREMYFSLFNPTLVEEK